jgi:plastocyanin
MTRLARLLGIALVAFALVAAGCGGDDEASETTETETTTETTTTEPTTTEPTSTAALQGSVGPGFDITLTADGVPVSTQAAGDQLLSVTDQSSAHNFHLTGPGVDVATSVAGEGAEDFSITLEPGTYTFVCDPHASQMRGSFEVTG